jgi:hypothetical protein
MKLIDWILGIFREARSTDPAAEISKHLRVDHDYKWFEVYSLDDNTFEFKLE